MIFKGDLVTGDFQEKTMTFEIEGDMTLQGGNYTILPTKIYEELVSGAKSELKALHIDSVSGCNHTYTMIGHQLNGHWQCTKCGNQKDL